MNCSDTNYATDVLYKDSKCLYTWRMSWKSITIIFLTVNSHAHKNDSLSTLRSCHRSIL